MTGCDGWRHHRLSGHEFEQTPGDGEGQGSLERCSPWGHKELDMMQQLDNNSNIGQMLTEMDYTVSQDSPMTAFLISI